MNKELNLLASGGTDKRVKVKQNVFSLLDLSANRDNYY
jgi:hypothetical protein